VVSSSRGPDSQGGSSCKCDKTREPGWVMLLVVQGGPFYALKGVVAMVFLQQVWGL